VKFSLRKDQGWVSREDHLLEKKRNRKRNSLNFLNSTFVITGRMRPESVPSIKPGKKGHPPSSLKVKRGPLSFTIGGGRLVLRKVTEKK